MALIIVAVVFMAPILVALALNIAGWRPHKTRNSGVLIEPPQDVVAAAVMLDDGTKLAWRDPSWSWTLLALPGAHCATQCHERLATLLRMRITLNQNAGRLRIIYLGPALDVGLLQALAPLRAGTDAAGRFASLRPHGDDALALALVDPNGLLMLRYDAGYEAVGVRADLMRLIH